LKVGTLPGGTQKYIRLIESRFLAPKKSLLLVEVGGEYLLLASSGDDIRFIKQIDMLEEIEVIGGAMSGRSFPGVFQNKIVDLVSRLPKKAAVPSSRQAESGGCR
jgi:flagellar protein FliO/FliZ